MNQGDHDIFFAEIAVKARAAANEFIDFARNFYAAESGSHDDEAEVPATDIGLSGGFSEFHLTDNVLTELNGIANDFESKSVIAHSRDDAQIAFGAAGDNDMVIMQARECAICILELNF
jgi:hypothetical protein